MSDRDATDSPGTQGARGSALSELDLHVMSSRDLSPEEPPDLPAYLVDGPASR